MEATLSNVRKSGALHPFGEVVSMSGVSKVYGEGETGTHALHDINLRVMAGDMVTICGPSGSGKTSLLHLAGMLESATEGSVVVASLLVSKLSEQSRADLRGDMIGFVFQAFSLIPVLTARENVLLPMMLRGRLEHAELATAQLRADSLLADMGLSKQAAHYPSRLDASQCQRVAIARALVGRPRLVIADEPTSRLDSQGVLLAGELFAREQQQHGTAFLITTRDQRQLNRATQALQLVDGRLLKASTGGNRRPFRAQL